LSPWRASSPARRSGPEGVCQLSISAPKPAIAGWKHAKSWAYSITYDEALADLDQFVLRVHHELGLPGHVEVVASQIGQVRDVGGSSYDGYRHMAADELRNIAAAGWGIGCHSWSHQRVMDDPDLELRVARETIEQAVGVPVTVFTAPGSNDNLTPEVVERLSGSGYLAGMSITDDINRVDGDALPWVNRVPLHERYWGVFDSAFDPWKRLRQAQVEHGWIVDYCHCPLETAAHDYKDCTAAHHRERLEAVVSEGGAECWYANPDDVIDYLHLKRHTRIEPCGSGFRVSIEALPERVQRRELTFEISGVLAPEALSVQVDGAAVTLFGPRAGCAAFTAGVRDGTIIAVADGRLRG